MEKTFDMQVMETKVKLVETLNIYKFPITVSQMIVNELLQTINVQTNQQLNNDKREFKEEKEGDIDG